MSWLWRILMYGGFWLVLRRHRAQRVNRVRQSFLLRRGRARFGR